VGLVAPFDALRNRHGERLDAAFHPAAVSRDAAHGGAQRDAGAIALIAHGVTSNKDRPYLVELAESLSRAGIASLRFTFAGNGGSEGRYEDSTPSKEVDDLGCVIDAAVAAGFPRVVCVGHSLGAAVGLLRAVRDGRVVALVSLAGMLHVERFMTRHFGTLQFGGPMLGRSGCPWSPALAEDAARMGSLLPEAAAVTVPWLLVHGTADELVPIGDAHDARVASGGRAELVTLPGADHRFAGATGAMTSTVTRWLLDAGPR
jgi:uncharacterized protein